MENKKSIKYFDAYYRIDFERVLDGECIDTVAQEYVNPGNFIKSVDRHKNTALGAARIRKHKFKTWLRTGNNLSELVDKYPTMDLVELVREFDIGVSIISRMLAAEACDEFKRAQRKRRRLTESHAYRKRAKKAKASATKKHVQPVKTNAHWALTEAWV